MFLARPERHRLKIATKTVAQPLYQVGENGPVSTDRAAAERAAFPLLRDKYYVEVTEKREIPKGNFSNVARCRANGVLLGPTNYHGYQPALRKLFEERFSRRMSFSDFQHDEIEVVADPALVEQWKQQAGSVSVFRLKPIEVPGKPKPEPPAEPVAESSPEPAEPAPVAEIPAETVPEPVSETPQAEQAPEEQAAPEPEAPAPVLYEGPVFASVAEVEQHFAKTYLPGVIRTASSVHVSGMASRAVSDRAIASSIRQAWEQERGFPGQMMHQLRQHFSRAGLHVFKHRKRMQFVSLIRPSPMEGGSLSPSVAQILEVIQANQKCNRVSLAAAILGTDETAIDAARKSTLATDLHWLIETGRVIEFSDGRLELPVVPAKPEPEKSKAPAAAKPVAIETTATEPAVAEPAVSEPVATDIPVTPVPEVPQPVDLPAPVVESEHSIPEPAADCFPAAEENPAPQPEASSI